MFYPPHLLRRTKSASLPTTVRHITSERSRVMPVPFVYVRMFQSRLRQRGCRSLPKLGWGLRPPHLPYDSQANLNHALRRRLWLIAP